MQQAQNLIHFVRGMVEMKILLSIKPEYANKILSGEKKYEFRRKIHKNQSVKTIIIYATKPIGKVIGEFSIKEIHSGHPILLWEQTKKFAGIEYPLFNRYFEGCSVGYAIEVKKIIKYANPMDLSDFIESGIAPQSYTYIKI
jgi:predicted transcriptional regulator